MLPTRRNLNLGRTHFTMIELLVVIVVIAILASVLLPALTAAREQARGTACLKNLKSMMTLVQIYLDDSRGQIVTEGGRNVSWSGSLYYGGYLRFADADSFICPDLNKNPAVEEDTCVYFAYSNNYSALRVEDGADLPTADLCKFAEDGSRSILFHRLNRPADFLFLADGKRHDRNDSHSKLWPKDNTVSWAAAPNRTHHAAMVTTAWADGHVSYADLTRLNETLTTSTILFAAR